MSTMTDDQLDLFSVEEVVAIQPKPVRLEDLPMVALDPARGEPGWHREEQFRDWQRRHGRFGSVFRSHGWTLSATSGAIPQDPADWPEHGLREFTRHLGCDSHAEDHRPRREPLETGGWSLLPGCFCVGATTTLSMVACACGWESEPAESYQAGIVEGLDHLWPGWRSMPVLTASWPDTELPQAKARWVERAVEAGYDRTWLEAGGPVKLDREGRHVAGRTPGKGYDIAWRSVATKT